METLHIKFDFGEAINSKKTILSTEINLLGSIKSMQQYKSLRKQELIKKSSLRTRLREANFIIKKLKVNLPRTRFAKEEQQEVIIERSKTKNLELELKEIRDKLATLA